MIKYFRMSINNRVIKSINNQLVSKYEPEPSRKIELSDDYIKTRTKRAQEHAYMALRAKTLSGRSLTHFECRDAADVALNLKMYLNKVVIEALIGIYRPVSEMFPEGQKCLVETFFWKRFKLVSSKISDYDIIANDADTILKASDMWYYVNVTMPRVFKDI